MDDVSVAEYGAGRADVAADPAAGRVPAPGPARADPGAAETVAAVAASAPAQARGENFPVALRVLPARYRRHLTALYTFARLTDDIGDEACPAVRSRLLDEVEADIARLFDARDGGVGGAAGGGPTLPAVRALAPLVAECGVPAEPLLDLVAANRRDQVVASYRTFDDLLGYCALSANPVGRVVLRVFGVSTCERVQLSDNICSALQLVEHWQDVAEDLGKGRVYLPSADMEEFGCTVADLGAPSAGPRVRALVAFQVRRASALLDAGAPLVGTLRGAARLAVAGYVAGGRAAVTAIESCGYDVLRTTPRPDRRTLAGYLCTTYLGGR